MPLHIFRHRMVNGAAITMFINGWNFVVQVYYIPTFCKYLLPILNLPLLNTRTRPISIRLFCRQSSFPPPAANPNSNTLKYPLWSNSNVPWPLPRIHPPRLGRLGHRSRSLLNSQYLLFSRQANRLCHPHRIRSRANPTTQSHCHSSRSRQTRHGHRDRNEKLC